MSSVYLLKLNLNFLPYLSVYGKIKSVRIPRKLSGSSKFRGFGFVDFVTKEDAKVKSNLCHGHLIILDFD